MIDLNQYKKDNISQEELEEFTDAFMRAKYDDDRKTHWQNMLDKRHHLQRTEAHPKSNRTKRYLYLWIASAAAVAFLLYLWMPGLTTAKGDYEQLADNFLAEEFYENREDSRGEQDITQINLQAIFAYNQKDFDTAIARYETIVSSGHANDEHHFFLGLSYLYSKRPAEAISNLRKVSELNANSKFIKENQWFLALAYLKNKQVDEGKNILLSITSGDWKYKQAQLLLQVIDS